MSVFFRKDRYGETRPSGCVFCGTSATAKNSQGIAVCQAHKNSELGALKCACGEYLDIREGKFGTFCLCMRCGPVNLNKALGMNPEATKQTESNKENNFSNKRVTNSANKPHPMVGDSKIARANAILDEYGKEKWVRSDDPRYEFK